MFSSAKKLNINSNSQSTLCYITVHDYACQLIKILVMNKLLPRGVILAHLLNVTLCIAACDAMLTKQTLHVKGKL